MQAVKACYASVGMGVGDQHRSSCTAWLSICEGGMCTWGSAQAHPYQVAEQLKNFSLTRSQGKSGSVMIVVLWSRRAPSSTERNPERMRVTQKWLKSDSGQTDPKVAQNWLKSDSILESFLSHFWSEDCSRASTRKICPKWGPRKSHEKTTKKAQTLVFQADEGHEKATESHEKVTSKNLTSNEKSSDLSHLGSLWGGALGVTFRSL